MKILYTTLLIFSAALGCTTHREHTTHVAGTSSSAIIAQSPKQVEDRTRLALKNSRISDLRVLFEPRSKISDLQNRKTCFILLSSATHGQEVPVQVDTSLHEVMSHSTYGGEYDGQLRVISRDSIIQTTIVGYNPNKALEILVHPGDLIFVQGRD
jgi:hypothetical protein